MNIVYSKDFKDGNEIVNGPNWKITTQSITKETNWRWERGNTINRHIFLAKLQNHPAEVCSAMKLLMLDIVAKIDKLHVGIYLPKCNI